MENKNPLEDIRNAILQSQLLGIDNEIAQLGVSEELLLICNALDKYYGIYRESLKVQSNEALIYNQFKTYAIVKAYKTRGITSLPINQSIVGDVYKEKKFSKTKTLLKEVKGPLIRMKDVLSKEDPFYLNLSSSIVSIALSEVVSSINSYQKPKYGEFHRYDPIYGLDNEFSGLVLGGLDVMKELNQFDMTDECFECYETNKKKLLTIESSIQEIIFHPRTTKSSSSGCLVFAFVFFTSIAACYSAVVLLF